MTTQNKLFNNKLKKLKSRSRSMVVWVMVRNGCGGGGVVSGGGDGGVALKPESD